MDQLFPMSQQLGDPEVDIWRPCQRLNVPWPLDLDFHNPPNPLSNLPKRAKSIPLHSTGIGLSKEYALQPSLWTTMCLPPSEYGYTKLYQDGKTISPKTMCLGPGATH
jgi:hypothetical protein